MRIILFALLMHACAFGNSYQTAIETRPEPRLRNHIEARRIKADLEAGKHAERMFKASDAIIKLLCFLYRYKGHHDVARFTEMEWNGNYSLYLLSPTALRDVGDHAPLNQWFADTYAFARWILGDSILERWHIDDINIINWTARVVFHPCYPEWDKLEYQKHFSPFSGVVTYWASFIACVATGISVPCSLVGIASEWVMVNWLSKPLSNGLYRALCERGECETLGYHCQTAACNYRNSAKHLHEAIYYLP